MDNRKKKILQAIVEEYINTAEPVSSGSLVNKYGLDLSSATIRNEMSDLEKVGYIEKLILRVVEYLLQEDIDYM